MPMPLQNTDFNDDDYVEIINRYLPKGQSIVFVGMMGAGKSTVGRKVAFKLQKDFVDTDVEIENSAQLTISEIFQFMVKNIFVKLNKKSFVVFSMNVQALFLLVVVLL